VNSACHAADFHDFLLYGFNLNHPLIIAGFNSTPFSLVFL